LADDAPGNMVSGPKPGAETTELKFVYDAWNRLVKVTDSAGTTTIAEYRYDGLGRRIAKLVPNGDDWDRTDYLYDEAWQVLEERTDTFEDLEGEGGARETPAETPAVQWLWDIRYVDTPVLRWRSVSGTLNEVLYVCNDANMNVTALVKTDGTVAERYVYDAYGEATVYDDDWSTTVDWDDSVKNEVRYSGYRYDWETGLDQVRNRYYHPTVALWMQRDPLGYGDGVNLYQYVRGNPLRWADPAGTHTFINCDNWCCYGKKVDKADLEKRVNEALERAKGMRDAFQMLAEVDRRSSFDPGALQKYIGRIQRRLDSIIKTLSDATIKCGGSGCGSGVVAYVWGGGKTIHLCCPFTRQSKADQIGTLVHEASHISGTQDPPSRMRDQKPTNPWWLENPDNAEAYEWWAEHEVGQWF